MLVDLEIKISANIWVFPPKYWPKRLIVLASVGVDKTHIFLMHSDNLHKKE